MKLLFLIADGMGDWPVPSLDGKTPLEAARTPAMDCLMRNARLGLCQTVPPGMPPGSDVANMALLGFDPAKYHTGRGPIEAAAQGLKLDTDDLVFRLNLVSLTEFNENGVMLDYSSGHITTPQAAALIGRLAEELQDTPYELYPGVQYRHLLVRKQGALTVDAEVEINPPHDITDKPIAQDMAAYSISPELLDFAIRAHRILTEPGNQTKANAVWPWGQGRPLITPKFRDAFGLAGAVISAVDLVKGLGRAAGMEVLEVPGATGLLDTDYEGKVQAALDFLKHGDFVYLHVEAPDECGHAGNVADKIEAIERFDARITAPLMKALPDAAFLIACDHLTPIKIKTHASDPVPFLLSWPGAPASSAIRLTETTAKASGLFIDQGHDLLPWIIEEIHRS